MDGEADGTAGAGDVTGGMPGAEPDAEGGDCNGTRPQAASIPTIKPLHTLTRKRFMGLILLEALGALVLLVLIVWWTMFSGRKNGELKDPAKDVSKDTSKNILNDKK